MTPTSPSSGRRAAVVSRSASQKLLKPVSSEESSRPEASAGRVGVTEPELDDAELSEAEVDVAVVEARAAVRGEVELGAGGTGAAVDGTGEGVEGAGVPEAASGEDEAAVAGADLRRRCFGFGFGAGSGLPSVGSGACSTNGWTRSYLRRTTQNVQRQRTAPSARTLSCDENTKMLTSHSEHFSRPDKKNKFVYQ